MKTCKNAQVNEKLEFYRKFNREVVGDELGFFKCFDLHKSVELEFGLKDISSLWQEYYAGDGRKKRQDAQSLYVHVPFCAAKCNFCCYDSVPYREELVRTYFEYMRSATGNFSPLAKDIRFDTVYFGGGTPNIFASRELDEILALVFGNFRISENPEIKVECNPNFSNREKLEIYKRYGFNRISFGVQSFDPEVLKQAMRPGQSDEAVYAAVRDAEAIGIEDVNMDIMFGLEGDDSDKFLLTMEKAFASRVGNIIIYKLMPTPDYYHKFLKREHISPEGPEKAIFERIYDLDRVFEGIRSLAIKHDYVFNEQELDYSAVNMGIGFKRSDLAARFDHDKRNYSFYVDFPMSCLGLGPFSMSHIFGSVYYKNMNTAMMIDGEQKMYTGNKIGMEAEILHDMAVQMEDADAIDIGRIEEKYRTSFKHHFHQALEDLVGLNAVKIDNGRISIADDSLKPSEFLLFFTSLKHLKLLYRQKLVLQRKPDHVQD